MRFPRELVPQMANRLLGANLHGIMASSNVEYGLVTERAWRPGAQPAYVSVVSTRSTPGQTSKRLLAPADGKGEKPGCGLTEPDFVEPGGMHRAPQSDEYVLNGEKMWITSAPSPTPNLGQSRGRRRPVVALVDRPPRFHLLRRARQMVAACICNLRVVPAGCPRTGEEPRPAPAAQVTAHVSQSGATASAGSHGSHVLLRHGSTILAAAQQFRD